MAHRFDNPFPELGVQPPSTAASPQVPTKLHTLRSRQLLDLATAFQIEMPPPRNKVNYTKQELLAYLQPHEEMGTFRQAPSSRYHLLHAQLTHDIRGEEGAEIQAALSRELVKAEHAEFPLDKKAQVALQKENPDSLYFWQQEAKSRGIKGTMGKGKDELRKMVEAHDNALVGPNETADDGNSPSGA